MSTPTFISVEQWARIERGLSGSYGSAIIGHEVWHGVRGDFHE